MAKYLNIQRYSMLMAVILVAVFYTGFSFYKYSAGILGGLSPIYDMLALGILCLPIVWQRVRQKEVRSGDKLVVFAFVAGLVFLSDLVFHPGGATLYLLMLHLGGLAFLVLCYVVFKNRETLLVARRAVLVCLILVVALNLFEVFYPSTFSPVFGFSAGLYVNPNSSALAVIVGLVLTIGLLPPQMRVVFLAFVGAGVFATVSRSGMIIFAVVTLALLVQGSVRPDWRRACVLANVATVLFFGVFFYYAYATVPAFHRSTDVKIGSAVGLIVDAPATAELAEDALVDPDQTSREIVAERAAEEAAEESKGAAEESKGAAEESKGAAEESKGASEESIRRESEMSRVGLLGDAIALFMQNPIFGAGMVQAWATTPHNVYALYGAAYGVIGWILLPALALVVVLSGDRRVSVPMALILLLGGMFSHTLTIDREILLSLALAAALKPEGFSKPKSSH